MSDAVGRFDLDDEDAGPEGLRSHAKSLEKLVKEQAKKLQEMETAQAQAGKARLLEDAKVPEWARELYTGEPTKESVDAWVGKYAEKFGIETGGPAEPTPEAATAAQVSGLLNQAPAAQTRSTADLEALFAHGSEADIAAAYPGFFAQH